MINAKTIGLALIFGAMLSFSGCSCKDAPVYSASKTGSLYDAASIMSRELLTNDLYKKNLNKPIILTSFVDLNRFHQSSNFGRLFSETLLTEISKRGCNILDFRGAGEVSISGDGEFYLSRDASKITKNIDNSYVLVGTYSSYDSGITVNARVIENETGLIISSSNIQVANSELKKMSEINFCQGIACKQKPKPKQKKAVIKTTKIVADDCRYGSECK
jgi:TolB-like protein